MSDAEGPVRVTGTFLALGVLAGLLAGASVRDSDVDPLAGVPAPGPDLTKAAAYLERFEQALSTGYSQPSVWWAIAAGVTVAVVCMASVVAHELGHVALARRYGCDIDEFYLHGVGGSVTFSDDDHLTAGRLAAIVAAGPAVTAILTLIFGGTLLTLGWPLFGGRESESGFAAAVYWVLAMGWAFNALALAVNLLPIRPLDGYQLYGALRLRLRRSGY